MSVELLFPITIMLLLSIGVGITTAALRSRLSQRALQGLTIVLTTSFVVFITTIRGRAELLRIIPLADAIIYSDWTLIFAFAFIGCGWGQIPGSALRKSIFLVPLAVLSLWLTYGSLLRSAPECHENWQNGVCIQTSEASCSAACAATVLVHHQIPATEAEMVRDCLTCIPQGREPGGTTFHGLYRGLCRKAVKAGLRVETHTGNVDRLLEEGSGPWIISVGLTARTASDPIYSEQYGWSPGLRHSVVLFRQVGTDRVEIGDPSVGREQWTLDDLNVLWLGDAIRICRDGSFK